MSLYEIKYETVYGNENILSKIDEVRFKRANIQMQFAMMMQENKEEEDIEKNDESTNTNIEKKRILKKS